MPYYLMLSTLTTEGRKTLKQNPGRLWEVNREIESRGIKIIAQYAILGIYDFCNILQARNNEEVASLAVDLGSRGTLNTMTMAAMTIEELIKNLREKPAQTL